MPSHTTGCNSFDGFFQKATGNSPFPFQRRFAEEQVLPQLVHVPTGLGKTAMAVLGWLWRKRFHSNEEIRKATPRRLVYCLPMRVLVEQTVKNAGKWIDALVGAQCIAPSSAPNIHILMGGEETEAWDIYPEEEAILIGTQDMLLSRLLNRGYAASRARWPIQFGLFNTDCLWVFDEIQLMGSGLATTTQMEAFRHRLGSQDGHGCQSVWMSATMPENESQPTDFDWRLTRFEGTHREQLRRWAQLPLENILMAIEEMEDIAHLLGTAPAGEDAGALRSVCVTEAPKQHSRQETTND
jgi:CRISPR-associated endonuclease/helicase Cas3